MGYSPKHAKPASLRGTALKTPLSGGAGSGPGRHRAGAQIPAPRLPGDSSVPRDPVTAPGLSEETAPAGGYDPAPRHAEEKIASAPRSLDRVGDRNSARAQALMRLVPLQRGPLAES